MNIFAQRHQNGYFCTIFKKRSCHPGAGIRGAPSLFPLTNLGFCPNQGGGGLTESQLFCKIVKTKLTFVNGQKCDETHNT